MCEHMGVVVPGLSLRSYASHDLTEERPLQSPAPCWPKRGITTHTGRASRGRGGHDHRSYGTTEAVLLSESIYLMVRFYGASAEDPGGGGGGGGKRGVL